MILILQIINCSKSSLNQTIAYGIVTWNLLNKNNYSLNPMRSVVSTDWKFLIFQSVCYSFEGNLCVRLFLRWCAKSIFVNENKNVWSWTQFCKKSQIVHEKKSNWLWLNYVPFGNANNMYLCLRVCSSYLFVRYIIAWL